jgi:hypothetical protein
MANITVLHKDALFLGTRLNRGTKHEPRWVYLKDSARTPGTTVDIREVWEGGTLSASRRATFAGLTEWETLGGYRRQETAHLFLTEDGLVVVCGGRTSAVTFQDTEKADKYKAMIDKYRQLIELHKRQHELMLQWAAAAAHEYGDW